MELEKLNAVADVASKVTYTGAGMGALLAFINANAGGLSLLVAVIGLLINLYYKHKAHKALLQRPMYRGYYGAAKYSQEHVRKERKKLDAERAALAAERAELDALRK